MFEELADAQAAAASSMSELAELRRQNKELQKQVHCLTPRSVRMWGQGCFGTVDLDACARQAVEATAICSMGVRMMAGSCRDVGPLHHLSC